MHGDEFAYLGTCQALDSGQLSPMFVVLGWVPKPDGLTWMWNQLVGVEPSMHLKSMALTTLSHRLRSVKMEQRKLSDQANTLVDLSKVSGRIQRPHKGSSDAGLSSPQVWL